MLEKDVGLIVLRRKTLVLWPRPAYVDMGEPLTATGHLNARVVARARARIQHVNNNKNNSTSNKNNNNNNAAVTNNSTKVLNDDVLATVISQDDQPGLLEGFIKYYYALTTPISSSSSSDEHDNEGGENDEMNDHGLYDEEGFGPEQPCLPGHIFTQGGVMVRLRAVFNPWDWANATYENTNLTNISNISSRLNSMTNPYGPLSSLNYEGSTDHVTLLIRPPPPPPTYSLEWLNPQPVTYGTWLDEGQLDARIVPPLAGTY